MVKVLHPGFYTTIQDLGRKDYQHLGVPISGAMDLHAHRIANALLGNGEDCATLEITMVGPKLEFSCDTTISITGAILSPQINGKPIGLNIAINISKGDELSFSKIQKGFRGYLAVYRGFQTEVVLNSRSMYQGITKSSYVKKGDVLKIEQKNHSNKKYSSIKLNEDYLDSSVIEVFKGPEFDKLNDLQIQSLFNKEFTISKDNNRMAYQLNELIKNDFKDIITSLVLPGTIQLTPSGKLIVLMRDSQTTGGYPRVLQLKETSINAMAQKFTGNKITFKLLS